MRDSNEKGRLILDTKVADNVRNIFKRLSGGLNLKK